MGSDEAVQQVDRKGAGEPAQLEAGGSLHNPTSSTLQTPAERPPGSH